MKVIGYLNALVAWRETVEEYAPERGIVLADQIELVRTAYSFVSFPNPSAPQIIPTMQFVSGKYSDESGSFAINRILMEPYGDIVETTTTDQAEIVLNDLVRRLDETLGYRLKDTIKRKSYASNIVVDFDVSLEDCLSKVNRISSAINAVRTEDNKFNIKRLAFGLPVLTPATDSVTQVEMTDFVIERRAGTPFEANRYFSTAPLRTEDHVRVLNEIEDILRDT